MEDVKKQIQIVVKNLFNADIDVELTRPDEQFGDYATNVALQLGKQLNRNPREIAEKIVVVSFLGVFEGNAGRLREHIRNVLQHNTRFRDLSYRQVEILEFDLQYMVNHKILLPMQVSGDEFYKFVLAEIDKER